jgi:hypothetical protein
MGMGEALERRVAQQYGLPSTLISGQGASIRVATRCCLFIADSLSSQNSRTIEAKRAQYGHEGKPSLVRGSRIAGGIYERVML